MVTYAKYLTGEGASHRHFHDSHQLLFIESGRADIKINGQLISAGKGKLVILSRFEKHSVSAGSDGFCRYVVRISPQSSIGGAMYPLFSNRPEGFSNIIDVSEYFDDFCFLFKKLTEEFKSSDVMSEKVTELICEQIFIMILRKMPLILSTKSDESFETVTSIQKTLETDFASSFSLSELASKHNMSISHLSHSFKKITGSSVMGYLLKCRLTEAKRLLTHSSLSISEIVDFCGFSDSSNFSRTFKTFSGLTPSEFRKKYWAIDKKAL